MSGISFRQTLFLIFATLMILTATTVYAAGGCQSLFAGLKHPVALVIATAKQLVILFFMRLLQHKAHQLIIISGFSGWPSCFP